MGVGEGGEGVVDGSGRGSEPGRVGEGGEGVASLLRLFPASGELWSVGTPGNVAMSQGWGGRNISVKILDPIFAVFQG